MHTRTHAILSELRDHAPFTLFGAGTGILAMLLFKGAPTEVSYRLFQVFHPAHVILAASVTASLYRLHEKSKSFLAVLLVGYFGAVGTATLSDCILPFYGETILDVSVPTEAKVHSHAGEHDAADEHEAESARPDIHLGFIEEWYLVNPAAILGVLIAWWRPRTKFPHAGHILISTWASSFHILMNTHRELSVLLLLGVFVVLFIAVWLPCCFSDIIFPMFFVRSPHLHAAHEHPAEASL
jgi:hypothetical protein